MSSLPSQDESTQERSTHNSQLEAATELELETVDDATISKEEDTTKTVPVVKENFPDGGLRAWLVVVGAVCNNAATFGLITSWGVFQAYYEQNILTTTSPSAIAWIGSIQYALVFLPALVAGRLYDLGHHKIPLFLASTLLVLSTVLTAQCTKYWHFLLCQGFAVGFACGIIYGPTMATMSHWFKKRLGLVLGIAAVGTSLGGTVFPIMSRSLIPIVGFQWTMRIIALAQFLLLSFGNLTVARRLPSVRAPGGLWNLRAFRYLPYTIYCGSGLVTYLGLYTLLTYIDISATTIGVNPHFSFYLVSIANASSGVARVSFGKLADRTGPLNLQIPMTTIAAILTYSWPFAKSQGPLIAIAILYGFSSGAYISLFFFPIMRMGDSSDVGRRLGMFMTIMAIGALIGPPISGAINAATSGFHAVGYYAGSVLLSAVGMMACVRYMLLGGLWGKA